MDRQELVDTAFGVLDAYDGEGYATVNVCAQAYGAGIENRPGTDSYTFTVSHTSPTGEYTCFIGNDLDIASRKVREQAPGRAAQLARLAHAAEVAKLREAAAALGYSIIDAHAHC